MAQLQQAGQRIRQLGQRLILDPIKHRHQHLSLAGGAAAAAVGAVAGITQSLRPLEQNAAGALHLGDVVTVILAPRIVAFVHMIALGGGHVHVDAAQIINGIHKLAEVDVGIVGDVHTEVLVEGLHRQLTVTVGPGVGQLLLAVTVD